MIEVTLVDYGSGNVLSAQQSFLKVAKDNNIKAQVEISNNLNVIRNSSHSFTGQGPSLLVCQV